MGEGAWSLRVSRRYRTHAFRLRLIWAVVLRMDGRKADPAFRIVRTAVRRDVRRNRVCD